MGDLLKEDTHLKSPLYLRNNFAFPNCVDRNYVIVSLSLQIK
jgi:hypothetical protein